MLSISQMNNIRFYHEPHKPTRTRG